MRLYCQCGYPIRVAGNWDGKEYRLRLYDGEQGTQGEPITHCPRCGEAVRPADLHWLSPLTSPAAQQQRPTYDPYANEQEPHSSERPV